ncbi:MAG: hypothetical protein DHS20C14_01940 [Phycisphaeraceae bacterium]|nr:MAG: hypothetical protein DHS20C14_01940 [Phycisphaeraceae bacterium]
MRTNLVTLGVLGTLFAGCSSGPVAPDLAAIYNDAAQSIGDARTPVVVIPGILGSKLEEPSSRIPVWGAFVYGAADADTPEGARLVALPMHESVPLRDLLDEVAPTDVLDRLKVDTLGFVRGVEFDAYVNIMRTLAAGKYRDPDLTEPGEIDYAGAHYTCFQHAYDWRRDIAESAAALDGRIREAQAAARSARGLPDGAPMRVDVVAHSMGGLVLRYYLRYGAQPLPEDGSLPSLTWAGATNVSNAILVGTPSAGSALSLEQLVHGKDLNPIAPNFRPAVLGTMPAVYQLLPRARHHAVIDADSGEPIDLFDPAVWERYGWGLADPDQDVYLRWLLPEADSREDRRRIALEHLTKCLARAEQTHRALDVPATPPPGTRLSLYAGDGVDTPAVYAVDARGRIRLAESAPGDGTVSRTSALMDERVGSAYAPGLRSPIAWDRVQFCFTNHIGLTRDPAFVDNVLYTLLEEPRTAR